MKKRYGFAAVVLFMFLLTACGGGTSSSDTSNTSNTLSDSDNIKQQVNSSELFGVNLTDTEDTAAATTSTESAQTSINAADGGACSPGIWFRGDFKHLSRDVNITIVGDTASVKVTDKISGNLYVDNTPDTIINPWHKPFNDTITRYAEFVRVLPGHWNLTKISPVDVDLTDTTQQTVQIQKVTASVGNQVVWEAASSSALYAVPNGLPTFKPDDVVLVEAQISNSTNSTLCSPATYVLLHRPGPCFFRRCRDVMYDDGTNGGDKVAGDGIFSRTYTIGQHIGYHFAAVDVIDAETYMNDTTDYNSTAWGIPYRVVPAQ
jgi:hypothetical protein